ncbi:PAPA-1-like conserved region-domain-containing protein [Daldinia sp. FL1419]|nr:PAPA-1-like conserved region-domain-containing protein [Daldinia sp. FL1419]
MTSRPRRAAAQRANTAITDMVDSDNHINSRTGRTMSSRNSRRSEGKSAAASDLRGPPSKPSDSNQHIHFTVKLPASKLRQATSSHAGQSSRQQPSTPGTGDGRRNRFQKKSYVVDTSDEDEDEAEDEVQVEEDDDDDDSDDDDDDDDDSGDDEDAEGEDDDMADEDAEGEIVVDDTMDIDAEGDEDDDLGEEDAEGEDDDMDVDPMPPPAPVIKVSRPQAKSTPPSKPKTPTKPNAKAAAFQARDSDDDEELSELESDTDEIHDTVKVGGGGEEDAEGEDEEIEATNIAEDEEDDADSDGGAETPDLTRMTKRQRARFEENGDSLLKLSDEVQAKKHFTAEEISMRRAEMARRRRNLSEKRNEEVKMETINKLLKKQAPKTNRKSQLAGESALGGESRKPNPVFVRWISNKDGSRVAVPAEMLSGSAGRVFVPGGLGSGKMVEEVS